MIKTVVWSMGLARDRDSAYIPGIINDFNYKSYSDVEEVIREFIKEQEEPGEKVSDYDVCRITTIIERFPVKEEEERQGE